MEGRQKQGRGDLNWKTRGNIDWKNYQRAVRDKMTMFELKMTGKTGKWTESIRNILSLHSYTPQLKQQR